MEYQLCFIQNQKRAFHVLSTLVDVSNPQESSTATHLKCQVSQEAVEIKRTVKLPKMKTDKLVVRRRCSMRNFLHKFPLPWSVISLTLNKSVNCASHLSWTNHKLQFTTFLRRTPDAVTIPSENVIHSTKLCFRVFHWKLSWISFL